MDPFPTGYSMPLGGGSLYGGPPWHLRGAKAIVVRYEADGELVRALLPPGVEPLEAPVQCVAWAVTYAESTLGPYNEVLMYVRVTIDGRPFLYCPLIYVDGDAPMAMGREVLGFPKKIADLRRRVEPSGPATFTLDRPRDKRLLTVTFTADRAAAPEEFDLLGPVALRVIPSSTGAALPSVCELLEMQADIHPSLRPGDVPDAWAGRGEVSMDSSSETDPLYRMAPTRILAAFEFGYDVVLRPAVRLRDYLAAGPEPGLRPRTVEGAG